jgi:hypothetical protein
MVRSENWKGIMDANFAVIHCVVSSSDGPVGFFIFGNGASPPSWARQLPDAINVMTAAAMVNLK